MGVLSNFWGMLQNGGIMMVFLGLASVLALAVIVEKFWNLRRPLVFPEVAKTALISMLEAGSVDKAEKYCREHPMALTRLVHAAVTSYHWGKEEMREAVLDQGRREVAALELYLVLLGTIAAVAPLMGLMGTVLGMMKTFQVIAVVGPGQADKLSGGISEALITTVTGLAIAVPALVFHNVFRARVGRYVLEMETFALHVMRTLGMRRSVLGVESPPGETPAEGPAAPPRGEEG